MGEEPKLINRPFLNCQEAANLLTKHYNLKPAHIQEMKSYADQNFFIQIDNPLTVGVGADKRRCDKFVLKFYNSRDSIDGNRIELSVNTMAYLSHKEFSCPLPVRNNQGKLLHLEKVECTHGNTEFVGRHGLFMVVLLSFVPGELLGSMDPVPDDTLIDAGRQLAMMHSILEASLSGVCEEEQLLQKLVKDFEEYNLNKPSTMCSGDWSLEGVTGQRYLLDLVDDAQLRDAVAKVIDLYDEHVKPMRHLLKKGIIHGDINTDNVLISKQPSMQPSSEKYQVSGIIDFGEVAYTCIIYDLAIAMSEIMDVNDISASATFLQGYLSQCSIPDADMKMLYYLVLVRFAQRVILPLEDYQSDPTNDYIMRDFENGTHLLLQLLKVPKSEVEAMWGIYK